MLRVDSNQRPINTTTTKPDLTTHLRSEQRGRSNLHLSEGNSPPRSSLYAPPLLFSSLEEITDSLGRKRIRKRKGEEKEG
ncbi:hypothetical protein MLD38_031861, partial [Melastoma candidum]